jgi:hypothetical protein
MGQRKMLHSFRILGLVCLAILGLSKASPAEVYGALRNPIASPVVHVVDQSPAAELAFWNEVKDSKDPEDFAKYLSAFPNGMFADPAAERYEALKGHKFQSSSVVSNSPVIEVKEPDPKAHSIVGTQKPKTAKKKAVTKKAKPALAKSKRKPSNVAGSTKINKIKKRKSAAVVASKSKKKKASIVRVSKQKACSDEDTCAVATKKKKSIWGKQLSQGGGRSGSSSGGGSGGGSSSGGSSSGGGSGGGSGDGGSGGGSGDGGSGGGSAGGPGGGWGGG